MKQISSEAAAAKMIKQELKKLFPLVKFSVKSSSYAGGNSVDVQWENGPTYDTIERVTGKYQYGNFDGMTDSYEYSNRRKDIPQAKYVQVSRRVTKDIQEQVFQYLRKTHNHFEKVQSIDESHPDLKNYWDIWDAREMVNRIVSKKDLTNGYQEEAIR
jgi:hypothetical protein